MAQQAMPALLERHELKYLIPLSMVEPISNFLSIYCNLDKYSESSSDGFYDIYSLYFDTPDFLFLRRRTEGTENRFNMRIRTYNTHTALPCFFEVKQKRNRTVRKYRATVHDHRWQDVFESSCRQLKEVDDPANEKEKKNAELFVRLAMSHLATPKVLTHYRRKAYFSVVDDYARVTFDADLRYQPEERFTLIPDENRMIHYDNSTVFDPECAVILELKCYTTQVPLWMLDLIRMFDLRQGRFSKYAASVGEVLSGIRHDSCDRVSCIDFDNPFG